MPQSLKIHLSQELPLPFSGFCHESFFMHLQGFSNHWHRTKPVMTVAENITQKLEAEMLKTSFPNSHDFHGCLGFACNLQSQITEYRRTSTPDPQQIHIRRSTPEQLPKQIVDTILLFAFPRIEKAWFSSAFLSVPHLTIYSLTFDHDLD